MPLVWVVVHTGSSHGIMTITYCVHLYYLRTPYAAVDLGGTDLLC